MQVCTKALTALSLSIATLGFANTPYSNLVVFGDSLSDGGYFSPITKGVLGVADSGKFTTNPDKVWAEVLGNHLGVSVTPNIAYANQAGNNYAIGGARSGTDFVNTQFGLPVSSVKTQINSHLSNNTLDPNTLYTVWVGANDLFAAQADPANAQAIVLSAISDNINAIKTLHDKGAKHILLANLPDVGLTPESINAGATAQTQATQTAHLYNTMLLNGVKATGANVIVMDAFSLLQEVNKNPTAYGFSNMNDAACVSTSLLCNQSTLTAPNAQTTHFFADGVHPTGKAHQTLGDYAYMVATAPSQLQSLAHLANRANITPSANTGIWATVQQSDNKIAGFKGDESGIVTGIGFAHKALKSTANAHSNGVTGVFVHHHKSDWQGANTWFDIAKTGAGIYHHNQLGRVTLTAQAGLDKVEINSNRTVSLGEYRTTHTGNTDGKRVFATALAGVPMTAGKANIVPYVGVDFSKVTLERLSENANSATAFTISEQNDEQTQGKAGIKASYGIAPNWQVVGDVHYQKMLSHHSGGGQVYVNSLPNHSFTTPTQVYDDKAVGASIGVRGQIGDVGIQIGATHTKWDKDKQTGGGLTVDWRF